MRRKLLIDPKFQLTFLTYSLATALVVILIFYAANLIFYWKFSQMGVALNLPQDHVFYQFINEQKRTMNFLFAVTSLVAVIALGVGGLLISHRVAGPIERLKNHMKSIARGETDREVTFRKGDFFIELADAYNAALKARAQKGKSSAS